CVPGSPVKESLYNAPNAGPKVPLMGHAGQPNKGDCQDISVEGGKDCYVALILDELFRVLGRTDKLRENTCPSSKEHVENVPC
ncbi:hypothetical protein A2U01_0072236, partial [Trifolium medium]|nr:hypothetical protein [Trifolium medium]